jgi:hypothetical protein
VDTTFLEVLKAEDQSNNELQRLPKLIRTRCYNYHIRRYLEIFPESQVKCFLFEDLDNMDQLLKDTFEFLGVSSEVEINTSLKYNAASAQTIESKTDWIRNMIPPSIKARMKRLLPTFFYSWYWNRRLGVHQSEKPPVKCPDDAKKYLVPVFTPVIKDLEELVARDLSPWLE